MSTRSLARALRLLLLALAAPTAQAQWEPVPLPATHLGAAVRVRAVAVRRADPTHLVFRVEGADPRARPPAQRIGLRTRRAPDAAALRRRWAPALADLTRDPRAPLATLTLSIAHADGAPFGRGTLELRALEDGDPLRPRFAQTLQLAFPDGQRIALAALADEPLALVPGALAALAARWPLPSEGALEGTLVDATSGATEPVEYELYDAWERLAALDDGRWLDGAVISTRPTRVPGAGPLQLARAAHELDTWERFARSPRWASGSAPEDVEPDAALLALAGDDVQVARREGASVATALDGTRHLLRVEPRAPWRPVTPGPLHPQARLIDVARLASSPAALLVASDRGDLFETADGGATWARVRAGTCGHLQPVRLLRAGDTALAHFPGTPGLLLRQRGSRP